MNAALVEPLSDVKIQDAARKMRGLKAPGPDGFQGILYQSFWDILREDVNQLIKELTQGLSTPGYLNVTNVVLIPKVPNPEMVT